MMRSMVIYSFIIVLVLLIKLVILSTPVYADVGCTLIATTEGNNNAPSANINLLGLNPTYSYAPDLFIYTSTGGNFIAHLENTPLTNISSLNKDYNVGFLVTRDGKTQYIVKISDQSGRYVCTTNTVVFTPSVGGGTTFTGSGQVTGGAGQFCDPPTDTILNTAIGCIAYDPQTLVSKILTWTLGFAGGIALLLMILGAFQMVTSAGNPDALKSGQERFTSAIIGLIFIVLAVTLLEIIGVDILQIPGLNR